MGRREVDENGKIYPLARDFAKGALARMSWELADALDNVCVEEYLDVERFVVLHEKGCNFCINTKELIKLTVHGAFTQRKCSWGLQRRLELKNALELPFACSAGKLEYAKSFDKFYREVLSGPLPDFGAAYFCFCAPHDLMPFLGNSKLGWSTTNFEYKSRADGGRPFFLGWQNWMLHAVATKDHSRLYATVTEWLHNYKLFRALEVPMSPMIAYLKREFVGGREPSSSTIRGHMYRVACGD